MGRDVNLIRFLIIRIKPAPPTHLKPSLGISISTARGVVWRPKSRAGFPNVITAQLSSPSWVFLVLCQLQRVTFLTSLPASVTITPDISSSWQTHQDEWTGPSSPVEELLKGYPFERPGWSMSCSFQQVRISVGCTAHLTCQRPRFLLPHFCRNGHWLGPGFSLGKGLFSSHSNKKWMS